MMESLPDPLSSADLLAAREALLAERVSASDRLAALTRDFDGIVESATSVSTDDEHDPEGATLAFERAHVASLADQARRRLFELDEAMDRFESGAYGICERCGNPIPAERVVARPSTRTCVTCAALRR